MPEPIEIEIESDLKSLIPRYLENRRTDLKTLEACLTNGDFATVVRIGHGMKGSGGGYGLTHLTDLGARLEEAGKAEVVDSIRAIRAELDDFLKRLVVTFVEA